MIATHKLHIVKKTQNEFLDFEAHFDLSDASKRSVNYYHLTFSDVLLSP